MLPWKPLLAIVPTGLLVGLVAGQASRPEMLIEDDRPWLESLAEAPDQSDSWPSFDLSPPESATRGYSYRPDIDYDMYVWPDQTDSSAELLAAGYDYAPSGTYDARYDNEDELPLTRRAVAELAGGRAERIAVEATSVPVTARTNAASAEGPSGSPSAERAGFVLPPVPPPLAVAGELPDEPEADEEEVF